MLKWSEMPEISGEVIFSYIFFEILNRKGWNLWGQMCWLWLSQGQISWTMCQALEASFLALGIFSGEPSHRHSRRGWKRWTQTFSMFMLPGWTTPNPQVRLQYQVLKTVDRHLFWNNAVFPQLLGLLIHFSLPNLPQRVQRYLKQLGISAGAACRIFSYKFW